MVIILLEVCERERKGEKYQKLINFDLHLLYSTVQVRMEGENMKYILISSTVHFNMQILLL